MKKHWKITIGIIILVLSIIGLFWFGIVYSLRLGQQGADHSSLTELISSNLRMPRSNANSKMNWFEIMDKNEWFDLVPIDVEEWQDIKCDFTGKDDWSEFIFREYYAHLSDVEKRASYCMSSHIRVRSHKELPKNYKDYLNISSLSGSRWYAPCLEVNFHEYILQYPNILNNILKIAERPCNYIQNLRAANCISNILSCNSFGQFPYRNERTCVIINIIGTNGELRNQIVVPRKDNNHLFNKK